MNNLEIFLRVCLFGFSLILTAVALFSMRRARGMKFLFAFAAFFVFLLEGLLLVLNIFFSSLDAVVNPQTLVVFNLIAIILFYGTVAR